VIELLSFSDSGWGYDLARGALATLQISAGAFGVALAIGLLAALAKLGPWPILRHIANSYTTLCRALPELLLIIILYYSGTSGINQLLTSLGWAGNFEISGFAAAVVVLGIVQGAYASEIIRGALLGVPNGLVEAGRAFALSPSQLFLRIRLPLMMPLALIGVSNVWMALLKESTLISVVGYTELLKTASQAAASTKHYFTFYMAAGAIYLAISLVSNFLVHLVEHSFRRHQKAF
jgi:polar amino acid transport system permease protein